MEQTADVLRRSFRIMLSLYFGSIFTAIIVLLYMASN